MKFIKAMAVIGVVFMMLSGVDAGASQGVRIKTLPNGLTVLVQPDTRFPLVSSRLYVHAGARFESPGQAGISHLLEHMVFKGTEKRAPGQIAAEIEGVGGYVNAATSFDYTVYTIDLPAEHWELGLDVFKDMIFGASIDPAELEQEKKVVLEELKRGRDSQGQRLFQSVQAQVWPDSAYGRPIIGFEETVSGFSREDVLTYIRDRYQPQSMVLVVCGDVDPDTCVARARELFGSLANTHSLVPDPDLSVVGRKGSVRVEKGAWNKVYLSAALPLPGFLAPDGPALEVLAHLLGGDRTSRLYKRFKYELRLVDDISVSPLLLEKSGMLYFSATLSEKNLVPFWKAFVRDLAALDASDFTGQELNRTRLGLEDGLFQAKETLSGLASKLGYFQFFEGRLQAEQEYVHALRHVDADELQEAVETYFRPSRLSVSALVPDSCTVEAGELERIVASDWKTVRESGEEDRPDAVGEPEVIDLGHGAKLVLQPDVTLPYTALTVAWPGGDHLLAADRQGTAALTAGLLTRGHGDMTFARVQEFLADRVSHVRAGAGRDRFFVSAKFPVRYEDDMCDLLTGMITAPTFSSGEFDRVVETQVAEIRETEDQPMGLLFRNVFPFLYPGSAYGYYHLGQGRSVRGLTREDVQAFWELQRSKPVVVSVCGQFDRKRILAFARKVAEREDGSPVGLSAPEWTDASTLDLHMEDRSQGHVLLLFPIPGMEHADTPSLTLLKTVLSGQGGVLFHKLREEQGLAYSVTALMWQAPKTGFFGLYIGTSPDKMDLAEQGFRDAVAELRTVDLPEGQVERARNLLRGNYYREHQSLGSRSREAAALLVRGLDRDFRRRLIAAAGEIAPEELRRVAGTYLDPDLAKVMRIKP
jgi:zinc protease